jgi:hypothetical protein
MPRTRLIGYGVLAALGVIAVAGTLYLVHRSDTAVPPAAAEATPPPPSKPESTASPATKSATKPATDADDAAVPSAQQIDRAARLIGDARRLAEDGEFDDAKAKLDAADKVIPGQTADVRRSIAEMSTPQGQLALKLSRARLAIAENDYTTAEQALAAAERIDPQAPEIAQVRQSLREAQQKQARRQQRLARLLTDMRQAIARRDFVGAARALNEAERLDIRDPAVDSARIELARAQDAESKD